MSPLAEADVPPSLRRQTPRDDLRLGPRLARSHAQHPMPGCRPAKQPPAVASRTIRLELSAVDDVGESRHGRRYTSLDVLRLAHQALLDVYREGLLLLRSGQREEEQHLPPRVRGVLDGAQ